MSLRETLQAIYASSDRQVAEAELDWWCGWARAVASAPSAIWPRDRSPALAWDPGLLDTH